MCIRGLLSAAVLSLVAASLVLAQQPANALLVPDSAELYAAFFHFHSDFSRWLDQTKLDQTNAVAPASAVAINIAHVLDNNAASHLKIDPADLGKLTGISQSVMAQLQIVDRDHAAYVNKRAKYEQPGDPAVLQGFAQRRQQAVLDGAGMLQKQLSPASWAGLHDYINNIHRLRYRSMPAVKK